jgi:hypothetical protein
MSDKPRHPAYGTTTLAAYNHGSLNFLAYYPAIILQLILIPVSRIYFKNFPISKILFLTDYLLFLNFVNS